MLKAFNTFFEFHGVRARGFNALRVIGKDRLGRMLAEAKEHFMIDPFEEQSFFLGKHGIFTVEFN